MSILKPSNDALITMARLVFEKSELNFLKVSFNINQHGNVIVWNHDDVKGTSEVYEIVTVSELLTSYIGLGLTLDLLANDTVTKGHRNEH